jgi:hypothetical protein
MMSPVGYDSVVVDAHLGLDRGTDLVNEMISEDPAAAAKCLMITGGAAGAIPDGVSLLVKPFHPGELLAAVRALHVPTARTGDHHPAGSQHSGRPPAAVSAPTPAQEPVAHRHQGSPLLAVTRRLRAQERSELVDVLHDGPIQELTAATLVLHMMRRSAPPDLAGRLADVQQRLDKAGRTLRSLIDGQWPFLKEETRLEDALPERTAWLLTTPLTVSLSQVAAALGPAEVPHVVDLVELLLFAMATDGPLALAEAAIDVAEAQISIELAATPPATDDPAAGYQSAAGPALAELAAALGITVQSKLGPQHWQAVITVSR